MYILRCFFVIILALEKPGSGVVLDCIDSCSLHHYLLLRHVLNSHGFIRDVFYDFV